MPAVKKVSPTGEKIPATPKYKLGYSTHNVFDGSSSGMLGDPSDRIGILTGSRKVPIRVKLEMMTDYRIALAHARVSAPLVSVPYQISCADDNKRAFFEAMWAPLHRAFMLQACQAIPIGYHPLIKKLEYQTPKPTLEQLTNGERPWSSSATPIIVTGFDPIYPPYCDPHFEDDLFSGITLKNVTTPSGKPKIIPLEYALWITRGLSESYGDYHGMGRLVYCYRRWWDSAFALDLRTRWIEKEVDPAIKVSYPPGEKTAADDPSSTTITNEKQAMDVGNAFRSGATVTVPSVTYQDVEGNYTSTRMWDLEFVDTPERMSQFKEILDEDTRDILMGYLVPPQSLYNASTGGLVGTGKSAAEVLSDVVEGMSILEWQNIVDHINEYVFALIDAYNFPPDSPPVYIEGTGEGGRPRFGNEDATPLYDLIMALANRQDVSWSWLDLQGIGEQLNLPIREAQDVEEEGGREPEAEAAEAVMSLARSGGVYAGDIHRPPAITIEAESDADLRQKAQQLKALANLPPDTPVNVVWTGDAADDD